jgi:hypothetical protein
MAIQAPEWTLSTHGNDPEAWSRAKGEVRATLVERARHRALIIYVDLAANVTGVPLPWAGGSSNLNYLLGQIMAEEVAAGRPLLPAVAVRMEEGSPGKGFYDAAGQLGIGEGTESIPLWIRELTRVHNFYHREG